MNTYIYKINDLQRDLANIVNFTAFTITATNELGESNTHSFHTAFAGPKGNFIPFPELTESAVIGWIKGMFDTYEDGVRSNQLEDQADAELDAYILRTHISTGLPW